MGFRDGAGMFHYITNIFSKICDIFGSNRKENTQWFVVWKEEADGDWHPGISPPTPLPWGHGGNSFKHFQHNNLKLLWVGLAVWCHGTEFFLRFKRFSHISDICVISIDFCGHCEIKPLYCVKDCEVKPIKWTQNILKIPKLSIKLTEEYAW